MRCARFRSLSGCLAAMAVLLAASTALADASLDGLIQSIQANSELSDEQRQQAVTTIEQLQADEETPAYIVSEVFMQL